jgi:hypothetical protein
MLASRVLLASILPASPSGCRGEPHRLPGADRTERAVPSLSGPYTGERGRLRYVHAPVAAGGPGQARIEALHIWLDGPHARRLNTLETASGS